MSNLMYLEANKRILVLDRKYRLIHILDEEVLIFVKSGLPDYILKWVVVNSSDNVIVISGKYRPTLTYRNYQVLTTNQGTAYALRFYT